MKKNFVSFSLISVVALLCGCNTKGALSDVETNEVDLETLSSDTISFDSLFCDVQFIPLENNPNAMLSLVPKFLVTKERFVAYNLGAYASVLLFDQDGKLQKSVGELGHGEGEYEDVFDISTTQEDNIVLSSFDRFMIYDANGKFLKQEKAPGNGVMSQIQCYAGGMVCASNYAGSSSLLQFLDTHYEHNGEMLPTNGVRHGNPPRMNRTLYVQGDTLYYYNPYSSEVFLISLPEKKILKHYSLVSKNILTLEKSIEEATSKSAIGNVDFAYAYYIAEGKMVCSLNFHETGAMLEIDTAKDKYTLRIQDGWFPEVNDIQNDYYYSILSQDLLLDLVNKVIYTTPKTREMILDAYKKTGQEVTDRNNFVVMKFKRKGA